MAVAIVRRSTTLISAFSVALIAQSSAALAASHEGIVEKCRQVMRPQIMACARAKGLFGNPEAVRQQCGIGLVRPCVIREEQKAAAQKPSPAAPKPKEDGSLATAPFIQPTFVAPPRTIADITAILNSEKPDETKIAERKAAADVQPSKDLSAAKLAQFYYDRANARALLGRNQEALDDGNQALAAASQAADTIALARIRQLIAIQYRLVGDLKKSTEVYEQIVRESTQGGRRGAIVNALESMTRNSVAMGEVSQADAYARRVEMLVQEARGSPNPKWRASYPIYGNSWEADGSAARAHIYQARGQYAEAEAAFRRAEAFRRASIADLPRYEFPLPSEQMLLAADLFRMSIASNKARQGRLSEAEADARRALLSVLKTRGKYSLVSAGFIFGLARVLTEEGRYADAEQLARAAIDVQRTVGIPDSASISASILSELGNILVLQRKPKQASAVYDELDKAIEHWTPLQREAKELSGSRIISLYAAGRIQAGISAAEQLLKRQVGLTGASSFDTAGARGILAMGYAKAERVSDALREFKAAIPTMMNAARDNSVEADPTLTSARMLRLQRVVEGYISLLSRSRNVASNIVADTFALADTVRGRNVQQSLAAATVRLVAKNPALAELVRSEQDRAKQIGAALGNLNNLLTLPSDQRDDPTIRAINAEIERLRADRKRSQQEIQRRFPSYSDLIDPKPPSVDQVKAVLRPGEAMLSFYFGQDASFVWAVPKDGPVGFASLPFGAIEVSAKVHRLREALEPQVASVEEIPPFNVALGYELYDMLLKPVEASWKGAKDLIVATNGALGELPLGLLPTAPAKVDLQEQPLFAGYRSVPWLARTHAVTVIPSSAALVSLRELPPSSPQREKLIGFGDPLFNLQQLAEADRTVDDALAQPEGQHLEAMSTRGIQLKLRAAPHTEEVDRSQIAMLPRLPDTREELIAMALALNADPAKALYLGKAANEHNVETIDLSRFRVVAFATHGLVPGDLDGLTQPALALTAPDVSGDKGDGLLTLEKILALKLDADWVVLSACNTAAGAGAGAEAASGLGSAFFYAGTRALLVTNWSVHSASARELISDLFRKQAADSGMSRGEALRQAMMTLLDGAGSVDKSGHPEFSYAHPLFWAPYSVIGDGGGN